MKNKTLLEMASVVFVKILTLLLAIINMVLIARGLGVEGRGVYASIFVFPQLIMAFTEGGMRQSAVHFIGKNHNNLNSVKSSLHIYNILASIFGFFSCYTLMSSNANFDTLIIILASCIVPISLTLNSYKGVLLGLRLVKQFNNALWFSKLISSFIILVLFLTDEMTLERLVIITLSAEIFSLFQVVFYIKKRGNIKFSFDKQILLMMVKKGFLYSIGFFLIQANYKLDLIMLAKWSNSFELGLYSVATQIGDVIWQIPSAVVLVLMSKIANSDGDDLNLVKVSTRSTLFICLIIALSLAVIIKPLILYLFGNDYSGVVHIYYYLLPGIVLGVIFKTINSYYAGIGQPVVSIFVMFIAVVFNVISNYMLIPTLGAKGAAISSTISYSLASTFILLYFCVKNNLSIKETIFIKNEDIKKIKK